MPKARILSAAAGLSFLMAATASGQNEPPSAPFKRVGGTGQSNMVTCAGPGSVCYPQSIAAGPNGTAWLLGTAKTSEGDYYVYQWKGSKWVRASVGAGTQIAVGLDGYPWVLTHSGAIYHWNGTTFVLADGGGCATSIGVGSGFGSSQFPYGIPWIIGCNGSSTTDGTIYEYTGEGWSVWPGGANRVAVSPQGVPVVITTSGSVWYLGTNGAFVETPPACANSVAAGSDFDPLSGPFADIWVTSCSDVNSQGADIFQLQKGTEWVQIPGVASQISLAPDTGAAWVLTLTGEIFKN